MNYDPAALPDIVFRNFLSGQWRSHVGVRVRGPEVHEVDPTQGLSNSNRGELNGDAVRRTPADPDRSRTSSFRPQGLVPAERTCPVGDALRLFRRVHK